jgi:dGTPase
MDGSFDSTLVSNLREPLKAALNNCRKQSVQKIYNHPEVIKIELTGYNVLGWLMNEFSEAVLNTKTTYNSKLISLMPDQFRTNSDDVYTRIQSVLDFVSGMTDLYAVKLYKDLRGIAD